MTEKSLTVMGFIILAMATGALIGRYGPENTATEGFVWPLLVIAGLLFVTRIAFAIYNAGYEKGRGRRK